MKSKINKNLAALAFSIAFIFMSVSVASAQTPNAWGYSTGYGNVYGTFGLAQTMQTMYNTTRRNIQTSSSSSNTKAAAPSNPRIAVPPRRVVRNHGVFRPDATLDTGKAIADALGDTPEEKALIRQIYIGTKAAYEKEAAPKGWNNNIAGGLTFFTVVAMTVYRDAEEPSNEAVGNYYKVLNASLDEIPEFATVSNKDKQNFNNMLIGFGGLLLAGYTEGKQNNDAATLENYKKLAGGLIQLVLKTDPENLQLENGQIVMR